MRHTFSRLLLLVAGWTLLVGMATADGNGTAAEFERAEFERDVASVLVRRCVECHQPGNASANLDLTSAAGLEQGGDSGAVVNREHPEDSYLLQRVTEAEMPPPSRGVPQPLPADEIAILRRWTERGAIWPDGRVLDLYERTSDVRGGRDFWSLQPLQPVDVPALPDAEAGADVNPIDAFVRVRLQTAGMHPAPPADPAALLNRMTIDTTGLKPDVKDVDSFLTDPSPQRLTATIDRLLASPQFGQRWARHWLDVVRFAESSGYERDQPKPFAWRYRDWVVEALNQDMPYDQFIREQLAGDELPGRTRSSVIATGFLRLGTWNDEPNDPEDYVYERLEDLVHVTSTAFLGLTVKCARCHDHKFDPIPQVDYYRMASAFWAGPVHARSREFLGGPTPEELGEEEVLGWTDLSSQPAPLHVLKNGERHQPLQAVTPASLSFRPELFREFRASEPQQNSTGRRRQLAEWIASARNPLTARVIVNRIWMHYFGQGLVRSPDNFGYTGDRPTHPELLDFLAGELIRNHWKLKSIHRLILTSATYQQSSQHPAEHTYNERDAANRLLWKAHRRRLDAETLRDSILQASGRLDRDTAGPGFFPSVSPEALEGLSRKAAAWTASSADEQRRRSLYIFSQRSLLPPLMTTFDLCDTTLPCGQRDVSIVAPQALTLLNNQFVHEQAESLAVHVLAQAAGDSAGDRSAVARAMWRAVLKREPTTEELRLAADHVQRQLQHLDAMQKNNTPETAEFQSAPENPAIRIGRESTAVSAVQQRLNTMLDQQTGLMLHLDAAAGVLADAAGRVLEWRDGRQDKFVALQPLTGAQPMIIAEAVHGLPAVRFSGIREFLRIDGQLLSHDALTVLIVAADQHPAGPQAGHRELLSNWSGQDGNSGTSVFVGLTRDAIVRFSDACVSGQPLHALDQPFLLTVSNGPAGASVYQQLTPLHHMDFALPPRRLDTPWVIGQQGNIDGEYWQGDIAEMLVFNRQLLAVEREALQKLLMLKYGLPRIADAKVPEPGLTPEQQAWASLALVLMNSNEFMFVD